MEQLLVESQLKTKTLQQILDNFTVLSDIRVAYFDKDQERVMGLDKPVCRFCKCIKAIPSLRKGCEMSDQRAFQEARLTQQLVLYRCHMGLWEAVQPLAIQGKTAGFLMIGQVRKQQSEVQENNVLAALNDALKQAGMSSEQIETIISAYSGLKVFSQEKLLAAVQMLKLITYVLIDTDVVRIRTRTVVESIRDFIIENYQTALSLQHIADHIGMNKNYISNLYHKETGLTITEHISGLRLNKAVFMLKNSSCSISQIASTCGFSDQNYFSRFFKKHTGQTPGDFRKNQLNPFHKKY